MNKKQEKSKGFTLIEMAVATTIFAIVLLSMKFINDCQKVVLSSQKAINTQITSKNSLEMLKQDIAFARVNLGTSFDGMSLNISKAMVDTTGNIVYGANGNEGWSITYELIDTDGINYNGSRDFNGDGVIDGNDVFKTCALRRVVKNASNVVQSTIMLSPYTIIPCMKSKNSDLTYFRTVTIDIDSGCEVDDADGNAIRILFWFVNRDGYGKPTSVTSTYNILIKNT